ncbi:MAG: VCBS repeat-containing protein [Candidatus Manganitrophaceae bacterium]
MPTRTLFVLAVLFFLILETGCVKTEPPPNPFRQPINYTVGESPSFAGTADLNQDGFLDLAIANTGNHSVFLLINNKEGGFQDPLRLKTGKQPRSIILGDFNEDGKIDLSALNNDEDNLFLYLNQGKSLYSAEPSVYLVGRAPFAGVTADFNGDHHLDLAIVSRYDRLVILLGVGDGTFRQGMEASPGATPTGILSGNFNADSFIDLAIANNGPGSNEFVFFWGQGDGTFQQGERLTAGLKPLSLLSDDFNKDGRPDIVVVNGLGDSLSLFLQGSDGRYAKPIPFGAEGGPVAAISADFDGDSLIDLVVANSRSNNISFLVGKGDGTFLHPPLNIYTGVAPFHLTSGDFNQDGNLDVVVVNNEEQTLSLLLGKPKKKKS